MREGTVRTESGGQLQFREDGDPKGVPVFGMHGTPGCRIWARPILESARKQRIRLIAYDRPGYGGSTRVPGRRVVDAAKEAATIADALGIDRFGVWGVSGGGAPALACAAEWPKRVVGVSSLCGIAPYTAEGLDWYAGMGELNVEDFRLMITDQPAWERKNRRERDELVAATPEQLRAIWASLLSKTDRAGLTDDVVDFLLTGIKEGLRIGDEGMRDDGLSQVRPWGFDPTAVHVPAQIWHGGDDRFVPLSHGQWLAAHVPRAEAHLLANEGHLTLFFHHVPSVHSWMAARF